MSPSQLYRILELVNEGSLLEQEGHDEGVSEPNATTVVQALSGAADPGDKAVVVGAGCV
jgi:hypothetical protein